MYLLSFSKYTYFGNFGNKNEEKTGIEENYLALEHNVTSTFGAVVHIFFLVSVRTFFLIKLNNFETNFFNKQNSD